MGFVVLLGALSALVYYGYSTHQMYSPEKDSSPMTKEGNAAADLSHDPAALATHTGNLIDAQVVLALAHDANNTGYVVAKNGMTLYTFDKDQKGVSTCKSACADLWPAYVVDMRAPLSVSDEVKGLLSSTTQADGSLQLTYDGMPLYFYKNDTKVGDMNGDGLNKVWHIIKH